MAYRQDIVTGIVMLLVSVVGLANAAGLPTGAAMLPTIALGILLLLSVAMIARGVIAARHCDVSPAQPFIAAPARLCIGILAMALYIAGIEVIGFYATTALFIPLTAVALGARNFRTVLVASVGFVAFVYIVFTVLFDRVLPTGIGFSIAMILAGGGSAFHV